MGTTIDAPAPGLSPSELADYDRAVIAGTVEGDVELAQDRELIRCSRSCIYFIRYYVRIKGEGFQEFDLWPDQVKAVKAVEHSKLVVFLKARQVGMTTLVIGWVVHQSIFKEGFVTLLFSKGHNEAKELLRRIRLAICMLPAWMRLAFDTDTKTELLLTNASQLISFGSMSSGGDSYTANAVIVDEADLVNNLDTILSGSKPTIDAGGKLILLSRTDKTNPESPFKRICRAAFEGKSEYVPVFFPWYSRPGRTQEWYEKIALEIQQRTFSVDELYANYPATPEQALSARELDKRFPLAWLDAVYEPLDPLPMSRLAGTPFAGWSNLEIYRLPEPGHKYVCGIDVAGGNPNSDDSVCVVVDAENLEEVAVLCGKIEPTVHAHRSAQFAAFYGHAEILPEKNHSHGQKCLEALKLLKCKILMGPDKKPGWFTDIVRKNLMYDTLAEAIRTVKMIVHSKATYDQLASLDVAELSAPFGFHDDRAIGIGLAVQGASRRLKKAEIQVVTGEPGAPATRAPTRFQGIRYVPTYDLWIASVETGNSRIDLGDYESEDAAAFAANVGAQLLGRECVNVVDEAPGVRERVEGILREKGAI